MEHKKEKRNERAAIQLGLFLVGLLLFGTVAGGQLTGEEKNGKEKAAIQTSGGVSDAAEPKRSPLPLMTVRIRSIRKYFWTAWQSEAQKPVFLLQGRMQKNIRS